MNFINKSISKGTELVYHCKNKIFQFFLSKNTQKTKEVALDIFKSATPQIINIASFYLYKSSDQRGLSFIFLILLIPVNRLIEQPKSWRENALTNVKTATDLVKMFDIACALKKSWQNLTS